jgi:hypothetical protein
MTGLPAKLHRCPGERQLGRELGHPPSDPGGDPAARFHAQQLQQRREPSAAPARDLGEGQLHAPKTREQSAGARATSSAAKATVGAARGAAERGASTAQRAPAGPTDMLEDPLLVVLEQPGPDRWSEGRFRLEGRTLEPDEAPVVGG